MKLGMGPSWEAVYPRWKRQYMKMLKTVCYTLHVVKGKDGRYVYLQDPKVSEILPRGPLLSNYPRTTTL